MIKVEHPNLSKIKEKHAEACYNYIIPRLNFCIDLFNSLGHKKNRNIQSIKNAYKLEAKSAKAIIKPFLKKKEKQATIKQIESVIKSGQHSIFNSKKKYKDLYSYCLNLRVNLKTIIEGNPDQLNQILKSTDFTSQAVTYFKHITEKIINYEALTDSSLKLNDNSVWNNYSLTGALEISVCPYCNKNYINTVKEGQYIKSNGETRDKITSPQLDHFFSKSDFPILRLSFFNLVPSCETCNVRLKGEIEFSYGENLHPYEEGYGKECRFESSPNDYEAMIGKGNNYDIFLNIEDSVSQQKRKKVEENHKVFEIDQIYADHTDIVSEIYRKKAISNKQYMKTIRQQYPDAGLTDEELYRLAFGNYQKPEDFKKRPFAKLTKDICEQLKLVK